MYRNGGVQSLSLEGLSVQRSRGMARRLLPHGRTIAMYKAAPHLPTLLYIYIQWGTTMRILDEFSYRIIMLNYLICIDLHLASN